jgi:hypothetical protein
MLVFWSSKALKPPVGARFPITWWLWAYWPVRNVARDGQHTGKEATFWANVTPSSPMSRSVLVRTDIDANVWSSVMITTMFGRRSSPERSSSPRPSATAPTRTAASAATAATPMISDLGRFRRRSSVPTTSFTSVGPRPG